MPRAGDAATTFEPDGVLDARLARADREPYRVMTRDASSP
jgi:hypothetical protein